MENTSRIVTSTTHSIRLFLLKASKDPLLSEELRQCAADLFWLSNVPYAPFRSIWIASDPSTRPSLISLFSGSHFVLSRPTPILKVETSEIGLYLVPNELGEAYAVCELHFEAFVDSVDESKQITIETHFLFQQFCRQSLFSSEELNARLKKLGDIAERNEYQELVKDISPRKDVIEPFSAYKNQLGFGLHVVLTMFTGYMLGHALSRALFSCNPAANAVGGPAGMVGGMLVETFLFVVGNSKYDPEFIKKRNSKLELRSSISSSKLKNNQ